MCNKIDNVELKLIILLFRLKFSQKFYKFSYPFDEEDFKDGFSHYLLVEKRKNLARNIGL